MKLLADTSALIALFLAREENHRAAADFLRANSRARFVMTELILAEVITLLRVRAGARRAAAIAEDLLRSRRYEIVFLDMDLLRGAIARMARFSDKRLSLADCASFEVIEKLDLFAAFAFDRDFRDCGYRMVP